MRPGTELGLLLGKQTMEPEGVCWALNAAKARKSFGLMMIQVPLFSLFPGDKPSKFPLKGGGSVWGGRRSLLGALGKFAAKRGGQGAKQRIINEKPPYLNNQTLWKNSEHATG